MRKKNYSAIAVLKYFTTFKRQFKIQLDDSLKYDNLKYDSLKYDSLKYDSLKYDSLKYLK